MDKPPVAPPEPDPLDPEPELPLPLPLPLPFPEPEFPLDPEPAPLDPLEPDPLDPLPLELPPEPDPPDPEPELPLPLPSVPDPELPDPLVPVLPDPLPEPEPLPLEPDPELPDPLAPAPEPFPELDALPELLAPVLLFEAVEPVELLAIAPHPAITLEAIRRDKDPATQLGVFTGVSTAEEFRARLLGLADTAAPECHRSKPGNSPLRALHDPHFSDEVDQKISAVIRVANHTKSCRSPTNEGRITPQ